MSVRDFGALPGGAPVQQVTLANEALRVSLLTLGACLQEVRLAGLDRNLTLGFPALAPYLTHFPSAGTIMGPVANRIGGARVVIDGQPHALERNFLGQHTLHGGGGATHTRVWELEDLSGTSAQLALALPDGLGGFPGNRRITARFSLDGPALTLELAAETDAPTPMNLANHSYWNLGPAPTTRGHRLMVAADHYLPTSDARQLLPTGEVASVAGTRFDYRSGREIEAGAEGLLDTNLCLSQARQALRHVARLTGPDGTQLDMETTEPGLQVFDGHILGKTAARSTDGRVTQGYAALALEAQFWPDAPNHAAFPDITLRPGQPWQQITRWRFASPASSWS